MSVKATASPRKRGKTKRTPSGTLSAAAKAASPETAPTGAADSVALPAPSSEANRAPEPTPATEPVGPPDAPGATVVQLDGGLQIKDVEEAHRRLIAAFDRGGAMAIDISRVGVVDTAGVQLLLSLAGEAARRSVALEMQGESPALTKALAALGLGGACRTTVP